MKNDQKTIFALLLQQQIGQKRPQQGQNGVGWFTDRLAEVSQTPLKTTNVYKWMSTSTVREVPAKFIKRKSGQAKDFISQALDLSDRERVDLIDAFYLSYAYNREAKDALLHLLDSHALEALGDYGRFKSLQQSVALPSLTAALDKFFAGIGCTRVTSSVVPSDADVAIRLRICATTAGLLHPSRLDAFVALINALYAARYPIDLLLCFDPAQDAKAKPHVLKRFFPFVFADAFAATQPLFSIRTARHTDALPFDALLLQDGRGYCMMEADAYLSWQAATAATLMDASFRRLWQAAQLPFAVQVTPDLSHDCICIANADAPLGKAPTYVLGDADADAPNAIPTLSNDRLGDNWVRFSYALGDRLYLIPYYIDDYVDAPLLSPLKQALSQGRPARAVAVLDEDMRQAAQTFCEYLGEISVANKVTD